MPCPRPSRCRPGSAQPAGRGRKCGGPGVTPGGRRSGQDRAPAVPLHGLQPGRPYRLAGLPEANRPVGTGHRPRQRRPGFAAQERCRITAAGRLRRSPRQARGLARAGPRDPGSPYPLRYTKQGRYLRGRRTSTPPAAPRPAPIRPRRRSDGTCWPGCRPATCGRRMESAWSNGNHPDGTRASAGRFSVRATPALMTVTRRGTVTNVTAAVWPHSAGQQLRARRAASCPASGKAMLTALPAGRAVASCPVARLRRSARFPARAGPDCPAGSAEAG